MKSVLKQGHERNRKNLRTSCLKFVRHEIDRYSHARSNAIQDHRRGEHVFAAI